MIEYWINSIRNIQLRTDELQPQILLVGTHLDRMDDTTADNIVDQLREKYRYGGGIAGDLVILLCVCVVCGVWLWVCDVSWK